MRLDGASVVMLVRTSFANDSRVQKEAASLARRGCAVKVIALWEPGLRRREVVDGVEVVRPPSRLLRSLSRRMGIGRKLAASGVRKEGLKHEARRWFYAVIASLDAAIFGLQAIREVWRTKSPAVVHAHDFNVLPAAWLLSRLTRARLVYDSHELHQFSVSMQVRPRLWRAACRWIECLAVRSADAVITVNEACAKAIARVHRTRRPLVLYNAPALADRNTAPRGGIRAMIGAARDERVAVYCGGLSPNRGIEQAIRAISHLAGVKLALLGYGETSYLESLRRFAEKNNAADRVYFVPPVPPSQVSSVMREADVSLVLIQDVGLSYHFSTPNKLFESLHAGLPIVGSDLPEIRRVLRKFGCGVPVAANSPAAIAAAMEEILADRVLRARLTEGARTAALHLNWEIEEAKLVGTYGAILGLQPDLAVAPRESSHVL